MKPNKIPKDLTEYVTPVSEKPTYIKKVPDTIKEGVYCLSCKQQLKKGDLKRHSETKKHKNNVKKVVALRIKRNIITKK